jgi:uncharacterized protein YkwD
MARKTQPSRLAQRLLVVAALAVIPTLSGATAQSAAAATRSHTTHTVKRHAPKKHHKAHTPAKHTVAKPAVAGRAAPIAVPASAPVAVSANCADGGLVPTTANLDRVRAATLCLIDQQRATAGLPGLRENAQLEVSATQHSADMVASNYFAHLPPTGISLIDQVLSAGYATAGTLVDLGENIATGLNSEATPAATVATWMASPGHRDNILNPGFTDTGIGVVAAAPALLGSGGAGATYTEWFGAAS